MAWIESHQEVAHHPKTRKLAKRLEISLPTAIGHLHLLWWWALTHAFDGDLTGWDAEDIALGARWEGDPEHFIKALLEARSKSGHGFLEQDGERLLLHDWDTYTAHLKARRESAQKANHVRWHEGRNVVDPSCEWCRTLNVSERTPQTPPAESTVPNRTEPDLTKEGAPTAQTVLAAALGSGKEYPERFRGHLGREIKTLLAEGISVENVQNAAKLCVVKGLSPSTLPSLVVQAQNQPARPVEPEDRLEAWN